MGNKRKKKKNRPTRFSIMDRSLRQGASIKGTASLFTHLIRKLEVERKGQERTTSPKRNFCSVLFAWCFGYLGLFLVAVFCFFFLSLRECGFTVLRSVSIGFD